MKRIFLLAITFVITIGLVPARAESPVVHAVLFYSPTCGHCHKVMTETLPPLQAKYGDQLVIQQVDVTQTEGNQLFQTVSQKYNVSGVPTLIIGDTVLVGSVDIPDKLPGLIESGIAQGGIPWPEIAGFAPQEPTGQPNQVINIPIVEQFGNTPSTSTQASPDQPLWQRRFNQDPLANSIAVIVLILMILSLLVVAYLFVTAPENLRPWPNWIVPLFSVLGIGVAAYLTYVEISHSNAICGPIGNCNSVQTSSYARLFGFFPVGVLGMLGYLAIGFAWLMKRYGLAKYQRSLTTIMWGMALFGVLFMVYLTFLEPFVIGATCAWCLSSAIIITTLLWATTFSMIPSLQEED